MSPDRLSSLSSLRKQGGFLLPVALFIIVVMGFASLALWRTTSQSSIASVQEVVTVQALYAAESGLQRGLSELFYPDASSVIPTDNRCAALDETIDFSGTTGLNVCEVSVRCSVIESGVYALSSEGRCGVGNVKAQRSLEASARF